MENKEKVNHPKHYNFGKFEVIDVIEDWQLNFNLGNAVKYIGRADHKGKKVEDIKKAIWYLNREIGESGQVLTIKDLCEKAHDNARKKGFWEDWDRIQEFKNMTVNISPDGEKQIYIDINNAISTRLMLIVSEVSEALEALRNNDGDNFAEELADVAIRLGDLCGGLNIDLQAEVIKKMEKNAARPYKHGKQF